MVQRVEDVRLNFHVALVFRSLHFTVTDTQRSWVPPHKLSKSTMVCHLGKDRLLSRLLVFVVSAPKVVSVVCAHCHKDHRECRKYRRRLSAVEQTAIAIHPEEVEGHRAESVPHVADDFLTGFPLVTHAQLRGQGDVVPRRPGTEERRHNLEHLPPELRRERAFEEQMLFRLDRFASSAHAVLNAWM